jgi:hypothetical protein
MRAVVSAANRLAEYWLALMSDTTWKQAAASIHDRLPRACGETTQIPEEGVLFDVSDSWQWVGNTDGDIRLTVEVLDCDGSDEPLAVREKLIPRA